jgi:hypothetical protein
MARRAIKERRAMRTRQHTSSRLGALAFALVAGAAALVPALAISQGGGGDPVGTQIVDSGQSTASVAMVPVNGSIDLCAKTGNVTVAGNSVPIWGYVVKPDGVACADARRRACPARRWWSPRTPGSRSHCTTR